jgi:dihydrodipicolinate synthase/N-acetylneuraminate lyase
MLAHPMERPLLAASVTPLRDDGDTLDVDAIAPLVRHLEEGGVDGIFCLGTTGEGVQLDHHERVRAATEFRVACTGTLIVHCGAQTTRETAALAEHAASIQADGVAVIPPPYYPLGEDELVEHFISAADACAPLPFYLYAFTARSGYPLSPAVITRVVERTSNVAGLKVSESPYESVSPYLSLGLRAFIGQEPLLPQALADGAYGSVSGLASAFPGDVRRVLDDPTEDNAARLLELRDLLGATSFIPALKWVLHNRGLPVRPAVRRPLQAVTDAHAARLATL